MLTINYLLQIKSRNKEPCMDKLLRLDEYFRVSTLDFVFYLSPILTHP